MNLELALQKTEEELEKLKEKETKILERKRKLTEKKTELIKQIEAEKNKQIADLIRTKVGELSESKVQILTEVLNDAKGKFENPEALKRDERSEEGYREDTKETEHRQYGTV